MEFKAEQSNQQPLESGAIKGDFSEVKYLLDNPEDYEFGKAFYEFLSILCSVDLENENT